jgi:putative copper export protein
MSGMEITLSALRGLHVAALCSLFGTLLSSLAVVRVPRATPGGKLLQSRLTRLARGSLWLALASGFVWFVAAAAEIAGAGDPTETLASVPTVALHSNFGHIAVARFILLLSLAALLRSPGLRGRALFGAVLIAGAALGLQAITSHAAAAEGLAGFGLAAAETLHVLAAGAWLGGLVPLLVCLQTVRVEFAAAALRRFFPLGCAAVLLLASTSMVQALALVGSVPALFGTAYGRIVLVKVLLFVVLLGFAALNRLVFSARLGGSLRHSIIGEAAFAVVLLASAGALAQLRPGAHEQPDWPFAWRLDPARTGHLIPAYPTSFYVAPATVTADSIVRGARLYASACASCHGAQGRGDGPVSRALARAPADLTTRRVQNYTDGDLFWLAGHEMATVEDALWDLVDYLRALNTGAFARSSGRRLSPARIPLFNAICAVGRAMAPGDVKGRALEIGVTQAGMGAPTLTVTWYDNPATPTAANECVAQPEALEAIATLLGTEPGELAGAQFLVDANGWLRARWKPGEVGGWGTPAALSSRLQAFAEHPLPVGPEGHAHRH